MNSNKRRLGGTGIAVVAGIIGTLLILALVFGVMMLVMGRCPMCGNMMN
ncbi:hypothetical protein [Roseimaritima ulvae]|uniref:Uncharacterized protein n=1 Tax=Roseimaritima ulvae TaxID=980254 RepID=A0A5B9QQ73_9BACT|nr:hypothetical protein [Roseimaritima ulvae]QEG41247.1 hypothetical protein UC8_32660 [Roseimaritima ulvae]